MPNHQGSSAVGRKRTPPLMRSSQVSCNARMQPSPSPIRAKPIARHPRQHAITSPRHAITSPAPPPLQPRSRLLIGQMATGWLTNCSPIAPPTIPSPSLSTHHRPVRSSQMQSSLPDHLSHPAHQPPCYPIVMCLIIVITRPHPTTTTTTTTTPPTQLPPRLPAHLSRVGRCMHRHPRSPPSRATERPPSPLRPTGLYVLRSTT